MQLMRNSYGYTVALTTNLDLTSATSIRVRMTPPASGGRAPIDKHFTGADVVSGAAGVLNLPIAEGDLADTGVYSIEAFDETPGRFVPSTVGAFSVFPTI